MQRRWYLLVTLTLANIVNFYDRTIPAVIVEPLKDEFGLSDTLIGLLESGEVDVSPLRTRIVPFTEAKQALEDAAAGATGDIKVLIEFPAGS